MIARDFLLSVLPDEGFLIVATPRPTADGKRTWWENSVVSTVDEMLAQATAWVYDGRDVYYALASYEKDKVWNAEKVNRRTGQKGGWERRTQANVKLIRSLFIDLDVKPGKEGNYQSQAEALIALRTFRREVNLPKPALVSSGFGIHAYWKFATAVSRDTWQAVAEKLKSCAIHCGLLADFGVTTDAARVLRPPGAFNFKHPPARPVELKTDAGPYALADLDIALSQYVSHNNVPTTPARAYKAPGAPQVALDGIEGNIGASNNPLVPDVLLYECNFFAGQVARRGAGAKEPQWYHAIGLAKFCEPQRDALLAVSDGHAGFSEAGLTEKVSNWTHGPPTCAKIQKEDPAACAGCPHWLNILSPATVGRKLNEPPPFTVGTISPEEQQEIPQPPSPFERTPYGNETKITIFDGDNKRQIICPYDLYPMNVLQSCNAENEIEDASMWSVVLPRKDKDSEVRVFRVEPELLADPRKLHAKLMTHGLHGLLARNMKILSNYMSAYTDKLARQVENNQTYNRMGWHNDHKVFVLPKLVFSRTGAVQKHIANSHLYIVTRNAIHSSGSLQEWIAHQHFYSGERKAFFRAFVFAAIGAPLFHMTGHKGILLSASGDTGRGKTTLLEACASVWGNPDLMLVSGGKNGTTINAMYSMLGSTHSLPFLWDDTTERDPAEMRDFMLQISQGRGKERLRGNEHDGNVVTWETMVLSSTNADDVHRLLASGKDSDPHLMRMMSIEFGVIDQSSKAKIEADKFRRGIRQHYGHAGPILADYYVKNYEAIKARVIATMERLDREVNFKSEERYVSAAISCMMVGGRIAHRLGVYPFDPVADLDWFKAHVSRSRTIHKQAVSTPAAVLDSYLNTFIGNTLIVNAKLAPNIRDAAGEPRISLFIRHEVDNGKIFISRDHFRIYCTEVKANYGSIEIDLRGRGVITRADCNKVLGAGTKWAMGQTRCWEIDRAELEKATA